MKKFGSIILSMIIFVLVPIVVIGWTLEFTFLNPLFYGRILDESDFLPELTRSLVQEYLQEELIKNTELPFISEQVFKEQIEKVVDQICEESAEACSAEDVAMEIDRWLQSDDPITTLDVVIPLGTIHDQVPLAIEKQYLDYVEGLPTCSAEDTQAYIVNPGGGNLPECIPPAEMIGADSPYAQPETLVNLFSREVSDQLAQFPREFSTQEHLTGRSEFFQIDRETLEEWDMSSQQFRKWLRELKLLLWIATGVLIWFALGAGAIHIPNWRKVMQWSTLPISIPASLVFMVAGSAWLAAKMITDVISVRFTSQMTNWPPYIEQILLEALKVFMKSFFGQVAVISGVIALVLWVIYFISFSLEKREKNKKM